MKDSWPRRVMANSRANPSARFVLVVLAEHADRKSGLTAPSVRTIGRLTGYSERQVQYDLKNLLTLEEIEIATPGGGRNRPTEYRITVQSTAPFHASKTVQSTKGVYRVNSGQFSAQGSTEIKGAHTAPEVSIRQTVPPLTTRIMPAVVNGHDHEKEGF